MKKRFLAVLLAAVTVLATVPLTSSASGIPFSDVHDSDYYSDAVQWAVNESVTNGTSATTFSPNNTCTQAQIITMIWRSFGCPEPTNQYDYTVNDAVPDDSSTAIEAVEESENECPVNDIKPSDYYYTAVLWAHDIGAFYGSYFEPDKPCTRAQAVWYLWIANGKVTVYGRGQLRFTGFDDVTAGTCTPYSVNNTGSSAYGYLSSLIINGIDYNNYYFAMALIWSTTKGVIYGTSSTTFSPDLACTRGQIVTMLYRNASAPEKCADGSHDYSAYNGEEQYIMTNATCSSNARYYQSCIYCGLSTKDSTGSTWYDRMNFFNEKILHSYKICVEPTTERCGLKYCTECGYQEHVARLSDHVHDWVYTHSLSGAYWAFDQLYGSKSTLLEYTAYSDDWLSVSRTTHLTIFKNSLESMDDAGKYYYKDGKPAGLITDDYISKLTLGSSQESTVYYYCSICGEKQTPSSLNELYGSNAIYGTYDTVYGNK